MGPGLIRPTFVRSACGTCAGKRKGRLFCEVFSISILCDGFVKNHRKSWVLKIQYACEIFLIRTFGSVMGL